MDFFVAASEEKQWTGKFVERDFYSVPTFVAAERQFVWAVPKGHQEGEEDRAIKSRAAQILAEYQKRRDQYIALRKRGVVKMLRDWVNDDGACRPPA